MAPVEIYVNDRRVHTLPAGGGSSKHGKAEVRYFGDEFGGYAVREGNEPLDSGALTQPGQESLTVRFTIREVKHADAGQPPNKVMGDLYLKRT